MTIFYKFKLPEGQIYLHSGKFGLVKKSPTPNYSWGKQSKCIFDSDRRFEFRRIRLFPSSRYRDSTLCVCAKSQRTSFSHIIDVVCELGASCEISLGLTRVR